MKYWITAFLATTLALNSFADNDEPDWAVQIGDGVSQTVHFCKLINGATMEDIAKLDAAGIKWLDKEKLRLGIDILTPVFDTFSSYDYISLHWATWKEWGTFWSKISESAEGQAIMNSYGSVEDCNVMVASVFPIMRKGVVIEDRDKVSTVEWCSRKEGISSDQLSAKHREIAASIKDDTSVIWWGVGYPQIGAQNKDLPGDFYHYMSYTDYAGLAASKHKVANEEGWRMLQDYYTSYADCNGQVAVSVNTIRQR